MVYEPGSHMATWCFPESDPLAITCLSHWRDIARICETDRFDGIFLDDFPALQHEMPCRIAGVPDPMVVLFTLTCIIRRLAPYR